MDEILHDPGSLNYYNCLDFRDLRWCKISSINSMSYNPKAYNLRISVKVEPRSSASASPSGNAPGSWSFYSNIPWQQTADVREKYAPSSALSQQQEDVRISGSPKNSASVSSSTRRRRTPSPEHITVLNPQSP